MTAMLQCYTMKFLLNCMRTMPLNLGYNSVRYIYLSLHVAILRIKVNHMFNVRVATDLCLSWPKVLNLATVRASLKTPV